MIMAISGPLVVAPEYWTLVFDREASTRWASLLAFGRYKHVRAYAYVPFLHVWVFLDPHLRGIDLFVAADGTPAQAVIQMWIVNADLLRVRRVSRETFCAPVLGFCVPIIRRLIGLPGSALRPTAFFEDCLRNGAQPFEAVDGHPAVSAAAA